MNYASVKEIESLLFDWTESTRQDQKDKILENHQPDAVIFGVLLPLQYQNKLAYRKSFDRWQQ